MGPRRLQVSRKFFAPSRLFLRIEGNCKRVAAFFHHGGPNVYPNLPQNLRKSPQFRRSPVQARGTSHPFTTTLTVLILGLLANLSTLAEIQHAFAAFLNGILASEPLVAAVDGKVAKQMKDESGDPILMLNVFAQNLKIHLASWSVRGDKTNEPVSDQTVCKL